MPYKDPEKRKAASIARSKKSRQMNPDKYAANKMRNVEARRLRAKKDPTAHSEAVRRRNLRAAYDMTPEECDRILIIQNGVCAICREPESLVIRGKIARLSVDHDHKTNKIRGLLCTDCNRAIGMMKDNSVRLRAAADYLEKSKSCQP